MLGELELAGAKICSSGISAGRLRGRRFVFFPFPDFTSYNVARAM